MVLTNPIHPHLLCFEDHVTPIAIVYSLPGLLCHRMTTVTHTAADRHILGSGVENFLQDSLSNIFISNCRTTVTITFPHHNPHYCKRSTHRESPQSHFASLPVSSRNSDRSATLNYQPISISDRAKTHTASLLSLRPNFQLNSYPLNRYKD